MTEPSAAARELIRLWRIKVGSFAIPERDYHDSEDYEQLAQDIVRTIAEQVAQAIARALAEKDAALATPRGRPRGDAEDAGGDALLVGSLLLVRDLQSRLSCPRLQSPQARRLPVQWLKGESEWTT